MAAGGCKGSEDFLAMYLNIPRGGDPQTYLVSADFQHCNYHVMADHDALMNVPRQYQQSSLLPWAMYESLVAEARTWDHGRRLFH